MKHITAPIKYVHISYLCSVVATAYLVLFGPMPKITYAEVAPVQTIVIFALQTASVNSAGDEFVVLMNIGESEIDLLNWELQYQSTAGTTWSVKAKLTGKAQPRQYYVVSTAGSGLEPIHDNLTSGLAGGGGHIRLVTSAVMGQSQIDLVGWGTASHALVQPAPAPAAGALIARKLDIDDMPSITGNNAVDFEELAALPAELTVVEGQDLDEVLSVEPTVLPIIVPSEEPVNESSTDQVSNQPPSTEVVSDVVSDDNDNSQNNLSENPQGTELIITELFPDPSPPALDSKDEFIELFNPSSVEVQLEGYMLYSGGNLTFKSALTGAIAPGGYRAFRSADFRQALGNTLGRAELRYGEVTVSTSATYENAIEGMSWSLVDGMWQWTATPTPSSRNIFTQVMQQSKTSPANTNKQSVSKPKASPTPKAPKAVSKAAASKASSTKASSAKDKKEGSGGQEVYEAPASQSTRNVALLAGVGGLAILYGIYEYRHDLSNRIKRCRNYISVRRKHG